MIVFLKLKFSFRRNYEAKYLYLVVINVLVLFNQLWTVLIYSSLPFILLFFDQFRLLLQSNNVVRQWPSKRQLWTWGVAQNVSGIFNFNTVYLIKFEWLKTKNKTLNPVLYWSLKHISSVKSIGQFHMASPILLSKAKEAVLTGYSLVS